ncbi:MAG: TlpA family protein disulfide reductase [Bacteroidales bacterium]
MKLILFTGIFLIFMSTMAQQFPEIKARSLSGNEYVFPAKASGKITLIVVAFKRQSQPVINQWVEFWENNFGNDGGFDFYEIPMLASGWKIMRGIIDGGMQSGVPSEKHDKTATYYGPLDHYYNDLEIDDPSIPYLFLLAPDGTIAWRSSGILTTDKKNQLLHHANQLNHEK